MPGTTNSTGGCSGGSSPVHVIGPTTSPVTASMIEHGSIGLIQQFGAGTDAIDVGAAARPGAAPMRL